MAAFNAVNSFIAALCNGSHNLSTAQLVLALTNAANPPVVGNTQLSNLTTIAYTNLSTRNIVTISSTQTAGLYKLLLTDHVLTASGAVAPFRYAVVYDDSSASDLLLGW